MNTEEIVQKLCLVCGNHGFTVDRGEPYVAIRECIDAIIENAVQARLEGLNAETMRKILGGPKV